VVARDPVLVELDDGQRARIVRPDDAVFGDTVAHQVRAQVPPEAVARDPAEERHGRAEARDRARSVERTAPGSRRDPTVQPDDQVDEGLAGDDDHGPMVVGV
jgi:hypothetical protein